MKKLRFIPIMLLLVGVLALSCFAVGCSKKEETLIPDGHTHTFSDEWTTDAQSHYHAATCEHTKLVKDKAYHDLVFASHPATETTCAFTGYYCVCGYAVLEDGTAATQHQFVDHEAKGDGCVTPLVSAYKTCSLCGYSTPRNVTPPKGEHTFNTAEWNSDVDYHYHASTCGHDDARKDQALHEFIGGSCTTCGYLEPKPLEYAYVGDTAYAVSGIGEYTDAVLYIPSVHDGKPVTGIYDEAFAGVTSLTDVIIPASVTSIGKHAFRGCTSLVHVEGGKNVEKIGRSAFYGCTSLTGVTLSSKLNEIEAYSFQDCASLQTLPLPGGLANIGEQAFAGCSSLTSVTLPAGVTILRNNLFFGCSSLSQVTLSASTTQIFLQAFYGCSSLTGITLPDKLERIGMGAFEKSGLTEITVPDSVTEIAPYVFRDCAQLKDAVISKKIILVSDNWFSGCGALESLALPFAGGHVDQEVAGNIVAFGYIFGTQNYEGAVAVKFNEGKSTEKTYYVPQSLTSVTIYGGSTKHWVNNDLTDEVKTYEIRPNTFENCTMIKTIRIGEAVKTISKGAFKNCTITSAIFDVTTGWKASNQALALSDDAAQNAAMLMTGDNSNENRSWRRS